MPRLLTDESVRRQITDLLAADQRPFESRLEAATFIYLSMAGHCHGDQLELQKEAIKLAAFIRKFVNDERM